MNIQSLLLHDVYEWQPVLSDVLDNLNNVEYFGQRPWRQGQHGWLTDMLTALWYLLMYYLKLYVNNCCCCYSCRCV